MDRRTKICLWIILLGLLNFLAYAVLYWFIWGEAVNGQVVSQEDGSLRYYLQSGQEVTRPIFLYSGLHSISIWPTVSAVMLAMLTLAKDRIVVTMRRSVVNGRIFITVLATIIAFTTAIATIWFILQFSRRLTCPLPALQAPPAVQAECH